MGISSNPNSDGDGANAGTNVKDGVKTVQFGIRRCELGRIPHQLSGNSAATSIRCHECGRERRDRKNKFAEAPTAASVLPLCRRCKRALCSGPALVHTKIADMDWLSRLREMSFVYDGWQFQVLIGDSPRSSVSPLGQQRLFPHCSNGVGRMPRQYLFNIESQYQIDESTSNSNNDPEESDDEGTIVLVAANSIDEEVSPCWHCCFPWRLLLH